MTDKSTFTSDEWKHILGSTMLAGMAVSAADQSSGLWGMLQESMAGGSALAEAQRDPNANGLIRSVIADFQTSAGRTSAREDLQATLSGVKSSADVQAKALDALKQVASILDTKAPADAAAFKSWLQTIGNRTANAASEGGGLFGIGGVVVSDAEKAALDRIAKALQQAA